MQTQKWVNLFLLAASVVVFIFLSKMMGALWEYFHLRTFSWTVEPPYLISFAAAIAVGVAARMNPVANVFLNEVVQELSRVTWPTRQETIASAGVVMVLLAIAALLIFGIDFFWTKVIRGVMTL